MSHKKSLNNPSSLCIHTLLSDTQHTHSHSLTHTHALTLTHTHTHSHTHTHTHKHVSSLKINEAVASYQLSHLLHVFPIPPPPLLPTFIRPLRVVQALSWGRFNYAFADNEDQLISSIPPQHMWTTCLLCVKIVIAEKMFV